MLFERKLQSWDSNCKKSICWKFKLEIEGRLFYKRIHESQDGQIKQNVLNALADCYYELNPVGGGKTWHIYRKKNMENIKVFFSLFLSTSLVWHDVVQRRRPQSIDLIKSFNLEIWDRRCDTLGLYWLVKILNIHIVNVCIYKKEEESACMYVRK